MEKFCRFEVHEYMDMYPHTEVRTIKGEDEAEITANAVAWARQMTSLYSGGPTRFVKILTKDEAAEYMVSQYKECLMDTCWPDDINMKEAIKVTSEKNIQLFFDCYGRSKSKED